METPGRQQGRQIWFQNWLHQKMSPHWHHHIARQRRCGSVWGGDGRPTHCVNIFATQIFLSQIVTNIVSESNCQSCPLCKARSSTNKDKCSVDKSSVDTFYFSVYVHKAYDDLDVSVEASNLEKVTCLNDDCGGTVSSDLDTQDGE